MNLALSLAELMERVAEGNDEHLHIKWSRLLNAEVDSPDYLMSLALINGKFTELHKQIQESDLRDRAKALYEGAVSSLAPYAMPTKFAGHTVGQVRAAQQQIDLLHLASEALPQGLVPDVQPVTIKVLISEIDDLLASLASAELDPKLERVVRDGLTTLRMTLENYGIFGADGAAKMYGSATAELARLYGTLPSSSPEKGVLAKAVKLAKKIGTAVIFVGAVVGGADKFLTDGTHLIGIADNIVDGEVDTDGNSEEAKASVANPKARPAPNAT